ncbi:unnamed protein product [Hymenolepis diminuta]|uniref:Uncharacterized protein n=1 Tax=Hymenolepis diminuta TaxID=6216 RepID=A0A564YGJ7_HYMDI|nr:unnamed protein product [Hymenolepis diminuta]
MPLNYMDLCGLNTRYFKLRFFHNILLLNSCPQNAFIPFRLTYSSNVNTENNRVVKS